MFSCAIQVAPTMFEEEEQEQQVTPLKAALEEAVSAAEAQGRSRQPGEATALLAISHLQICTVCPAVVSVALLLLWVQCVFHVLLEQIFALLQDLRPTECKACSHHMLACTASLAVVTHPMQTA